jgi:hypothetical protein
MHRQNPIAIAITLGLAACSYVSDPNNGGGETGGPIQLSEGPLESENPPEWVCRERAPDVTLAGYDAPIPELERCYYSPHAKDMDGDGADETESWGWPGKPHWQGLPTVMYWLNQPNPDEVHPVYMWYDASANGNYALHKYNVSSPWLPEWPYEFRSGLVSNFALWIGGVPDSAPRPPIVTASFIDVMNFEIPTIFGNPFYEGRYNAHGVPCSTNPPAEAMGYGWSPVLNQYSASPNAECEAWVEYYGVLAVAPEYPLYSASQDIMIGVAQEHAVCLDNGGVYKVSEAALTADQRNGLIWINWGEFWEDFVLWLQTEHPEVHSLIVAMDYLQNTGWNSWPVDPPYPYNNWSVTGMCSHAVMLTEYNGTIRTGIPCPIGMIPVFPKYDPEDILDEIDVHGYCSFPKSLPPEIADMTPIDVITAKRGIGFDGARYVNLARITHEMLKAWTESVTLTETARGIVVNAKNDLGRDLLEALEIPEGSRIIGVNQLMTKDHPETGEPGATVWEVAIDIDQHFSDMRMAVVLLDAPDGMRHHRYIVPYARR